MSQSRRTSKLTYVSDEETPKKKLKNDAEMGRILRKRRSSGEECLKFMQTLIDENDINSGGSNKEKIERGNERGTQWMIQVIFYQTNSINSLPKIAKPLRQIEP